MFCPSLAFKHRRPTPGQSLPQTLQPLQRQRETRTRFGSCHAAPVSGHRAVKALVCMIDEVLGIIL